MQVGYDDNATKKPKQVRRQAGQEFDQLEAREAVALRQQLRHDYINQTFSGTDAMFRVMFTDIQTFLKKMSLGADLKLATQIIKGRAVEFSRIGVITSSKGDNKYGNPAIFMRVTLGKQHKHISVSFSDSLTEDQKTEAREFVKAGLSQLTFRSLAEARPAVVDLVTLFEDIHEITKPDKRSPLSKSLDIKEEKKQVGSLYLLGPRITKTTPPMALFLISTTPTSDSRLASVTRAFGYGDEVIEDKALAAKAKSNIAQAQAGIEKALALFQVGVAPAKIAEDVPGETGQSNKFKDEALEAKLKKLLADNVPDFSKKRGGRK